MKRTRALAILVLLSITASSACGGGDSVTTEDPAPPPAPTPPVPPSVPPPTPAPNPSGGRMPDPPASCANAQPLPPARPQAEALRILSTLDQDSTEETLRGALTRIDAMIAQNPQDPDAHYARGVLLGPLGGSPAERFASYQRALAIDPNYADAAYNAGVAQGAAGDDAAALEWFTRATVIDPSRPDAHYNAGQAAYNLGRFDRSLEAFLCARAHTPEPFDETKKVVQALHALGRFADAIAARNILWQIRGASREPRIAAATEAVIDQFQVEGHLVMVSETVPPGPADLRYVYIARAYEEGRVVQQAQLETSAVIQEMGTAAIIGYQEGPTHHTTPMGFREMPTYEAVRPTLQGVIADLLLGRPVASGASSTPR